MPKESFSPEYEFEGKIGTVKQLAQAYTHNTYALRRSNNKLNGLCIAAEKCEGAH